MNWEAHPVADIFPMMSAHELDELAADIRVNGLREPIWLYDGKIIDGRNRAEACVRADVPIRTRGYEGDPSKLVAFVVSLNLKRRHLSESQRAMVAANIATMKVGRPSETAAIEAVSQQQAADMLNVSRAAVQRAAKVRDEAAPELVEAVQSGRVSVSAAADVAELPKPEQVEVVARGETEILQAAKRIREQRVLESREKREAEKREAMAQPIPAGQYRTIVIDPPWEMEKIVRDNRPNPVNFGFEYPTMSEDELAAFDVAAMSADDCHLFCWTTHKHLPMALRLVERWGFKYVLCMVWHKPGGFQPFNLPQYNNEFCIYARRGAPEFVETKAFFTCFEAPRREHSRKPDEFYDVIRRVAPAPRIDVFSREPREGFDQFGNETEKFNEAA